ncbi:MAG: sulfurtransferase TusA family protein [Syntrophobacterales bacterium]|nr:sulfurtransferase TusA family protein [Syntrophobacterales bacterium]
MEELVDVRGLSCPQPLLVTIEKIKTTQSSQLKVLVDTDTARENITIVVKSVGWRVLEVEPSALGYIITIERVF